MREYSFHLHKNWLDEDFFEATLSLQSHDAAVNLDIYTGTEELHDLHQKLIRFSTTMAKEEMVWITGGEAPTFNHYVYMRFFKHSVLGKIAVEVKVKKHTEAPYAMSAHFFLFTYLAGVDDLARQLEKMISGEAIEAFGL